eukprot:1753034-Pleurochrysis_carterae.AAC.2
MRSPPARKAQAAHAKQPASPECSRTQACGHCRCNQSLTPPHFAAERKRAPSCARSKAGAERTCSRCGGSRSGYERTVRAAQPPSSLRLRDRACSPLPTVPLPLATPRCR